MKTTQEFVFRNESNAVLKFKIVEETAHWHTAYRYISCLHHSLYYEFANFLCIYFLLSANKKSFLNTFFANHFTCGGFAHKMYIICIIMNEYHDWFREIQMLLEVDWGTTHIYSIDVAAASIARFFTFLTPLTTIN